MKHFWGDSKPDHHLHPLSWFADGAGLRADHRESGTVSVWQADRELSEADAIGGSGSGTVSVIDGATDTVTTTVPIGDLPYVVAVDLLTDKVYVSKTFSNTTTVIDGKTNQPSILKAGVQADAIAVGYGTNRIYMTSYEGSKVTVVDGKSESATTSMWINIFGGSRRFTRPGDSM